MQDFDPPKLQGSAPTGTGLMGLTTAVSETLKAPLILAMATRPYQGKHSPPLEERIKIQYRTQGVLETLMKRFLAFFCFLSAKFQLVDAISQPVGDALLRGFALALFYQLRSLD